MDVEDKYGSPQYLNFTHMFDGETYIVEVEYFSYPWDTIVYYCGEEYFSNIDIVAIVVYDAQGNLINSVYIDRDIILREIDIDDEMKYGGGF